MKTYDNDEKKVKTGTVNSRKSTAAAKTKTSANSKPSTAAKKKSPYTGDAESDFHTFFVDALKDIYWAEEHLKKGLRKMCEASTSSELAAAFKKHYNEGDEQLADLKSVFALLGEKAEGKKCEAMAGLLKEAEEIIKDTKRNSFVRDAGLILAAQKVEHYEIATYGTLRALAVYLPEKKIQKLLDKILTEEKRTDAALSKLAEAFVNECAAVE